MTTKFLPGHKYKTVGGWDALVDLVETNGEMRVSHYWTEDSTYWPVKHTSAGEVVAEAPTWNLIELPFTTADARLIYHDIFAGEPWAEVAKTLGYKPEDMESQARLVLKKATDKYGWRAPVVEADGLKRAKLELEASQARLAAERDRLRELEYEIADLADNADQAANDLGFAIDKLSELV